MNDWISVHIFFQDNLDRLILDCVDPLLEEIRHDAPEAFFLRYWNGGPHVRLRFKPNTEASGKHAMLVAQNIVEKYLLESPSTDRISQADYLESGHGLAQREGVELVDSLYPNNSAHLIAYKREHDRYGYGASIQAVEDHFVESSSIALEILRLTDETAKRETAMTAFLCLAWIISSPNPDDLTSSQTRAASRSTAENDSETLEATYVGQEERLQQLMETVFHIALNWRQLPIDNYLVRWARSINCLVDSLRNDKTVAVERVADLCAHLMANRLGVRIEAEGSLRYMASRAIDHHNRLGAY